MSFTNPPEQPGQLGQLGQSPLTLAEAAELGGVA